jgi:hypothetical protein
VVWGWLRTTTLPCHGKNKQPLLIISTSVKQSLQVRCLVTYHRRKYNVRNWLIGWRLFIGLSSMVCSLTLVTFVCVGMRVRIKKRVFVRHQKIIITGWKDNINNNAIRTHEHFWNKKANWGETVHFPTLREKAKSVIPIWVPWNIICVPREIAE